MQTKQLGNSDMNLTAIGIGAWAIGGGGWAFGWGPQDDNESIDAMREALDRGVNWIDTAAVYGLGHSEEMVAKALEGRAKKPYVFTKCERVWNEKREIGKSLKADSIRCEVEDSLRRLKLDVIDLYQIHWPEPDEDIEEGWTEMARLKEQGKVRYIGVSNFNADQMKRAAKIAPITSLQPPYSLISPEIEEQILPYTGANNIGVIVYSPMKRRTVERFDDAGADCGDAGGRFPEARGSISGAEDHEEPGTGGADARDGQPLWTDARGSGDCLDAAAAGGDGGYRWGAIGEAGGRRDWGAGFPAFTGRGLRTGIDAALIGDTDK